MSEYGFPSIHATLSRYLHLNPSARYVLLRAGVFAFSGEQLADPYASYFNIDEGWTVMPEYEEVAREFLDTLRSQLPFFGGPQSAVLVAFREEAGVRCVLGRSWVDTSGARPTHDFAVVVDGRRHRARVGSVCASLQDVAEDGSLCMVERFSSGKAPGPEVQLHVPRSFQAGQNQLLGINLPGMLSLREPDQEELLAWSLAEYGPLPLGDDLPALRPYRKAA